MLSIFACCELFKLCFYLLHFFKIDIQKLFSVKKNSHFLLALCVMIQKQNNENAYFQNEELRVRILKNTLYLKQLMQFSLTILSRTQFPLIILTLKIFIFQLQDRTQFSDQDLAMLKKFWDNGMTSLGSVCREKIEAVATELNVDCEIVRVRHFQYFSCHIWYMV